MTKKCYKCNKIKKTTEFYKKSSNTTDKLCGRCKKCDNVLKAIRTQARRLNDDELTLMNDKLEKWFNKISLW